MIVAAHTQRQTLRLVEFYPPHEPRESDPHYHLFEAARRHMKSTDKWRSYVTGRTEEEVGASLEAHHGVIEFALQNGIDPHVFEELHPEFKGLLDGSEEAMIRFVESERNIMPLEVDFHRGHHGIHVLPYPIWEAFRYWKGDLPLPGRKE